MRVYVYGQYCNGGRITDPAKLQENVDKAIRVGRELFLRGHQPMVPHLYHFMDYDRIIPYDVVMTTCLEYLQFCEVMVCADGGPSDGANDEEKEGEKLGIPIFSSLDEFIIWDDQRKYGGKI